MGSIVQGQLNWDQSPLYDTYELASGQALPTKIVFFENPTGASKTKAKTNLTDGFQLTGGEKFQVRALRFAGVGMDRTDFTEFDKKYVATLYVSGKPRLEAPIGFWPGGAGLSGYATTTATTTTIHHVDNGAPDPRAVNVLSEPIMINVGEKFRVELDGTSFTSTAAVTLRCYLDGLYGRLIG